MSEVRRVAGLPEAPPAAPAPGVPRINWRNALFFIALHLIAILALLPWYFSWTGVVLCFLGIFVFGMLGINIGYHRLLTHRGFTCPKWVERTLSILGCCCAQDSPAYWVAIHRRHHHYADEAPDPHTPNQGFFWGHVGWLVFKSPDLDRHPLMDRYAKDLKRDPFQAWLIKSDNWIFVAIASWLLFFVGGFLASLATGDSVAEAVQFGASLFVWGAILRTVLQLHFTWSVNSAAHMWGYRNYQTPDDSRNNALVALLTNGEGWHNNHHADPRSARHGHTWWELDLSWLTIRLMMALGLAKEVALPSVILAEKFPHAPRLAPDTTTPPAAHTHASLAPDSEPGGESPAEPGKGTLGASGRRSKLS
jgi:stearoyl-CoA desaturase (delta-9 desaturase)